jgi:hypothetical protein
MIYTKSDCTECTRKNVYILKHTYSKKYCMVCNKKRVGDKAKEKIKKRKFYKKENTGQMIVFDRIWKTRPHMSFVSNEKLNDVLMPVYFAHVIPKAANRYPKFKLNERNIVLLTWDEHMQWDQGVRADIKNNPKWDKMFALEADLKLEYKALYGT